MCLYSFFFFFGARLPVAPAELQPSEEVHHGPDKLRHVHQQLLRVGVHEEEPHLLSGMEAKHAAYLFHVKKRNFAISDTKRDLTAVKET